MSSSGKGQSTIHTANDASNAWTYAQSGGRTGAGGVIIEGFVDFDYEITLLTVRHRDGTSFCEPIGHRQEEGRLSRIMAAPADVGTGIDESAADGAIGDGCTWWFMACLALNFLCKVMRLSLVKCRRDLTTPAW